MGYAGFLQIDLLSLVLSQTESTNLAQPYLCKGQKKKKKRTWSFHRSGKISACIWRIVFFFLPLRMPNVDSAGKSGKEASRERVNKRM